MLDFLKQRFYGPKETKSQNQPVRLTLEEFESRFLPNAGPLFGAALGFGGPALGAPPPLPGPSFAGSMGFGGSALAGLPDPSSHPPALTATLTGATGTSGTVTFTLNPSAGTNTLLVQVSGLTANTTYSVKSGTTTLGTITTDANGSGQLSSSNVSPGLTPGQAITVLDPSGATVLSGTLAGPSCASGSSPGQGSTPGSPTGTGSGSATPTSTDASTLATDLLSGNLSGALAALNDFQTYLSSLQSLPLQELQTLMFLDQVFSDLAAG